MDQHTEMENNSDREENFEDANDTPPQSRSSTPGRSLTSRSRSISSSRRKSSRSSTPLPGVPESNLEEGNQGNKDKDSAVVSEPISVAGMDDVSLEEGSGKARRSISPVKSSRNSTDSTSSTTTDNPPLRQSSPVAPQRSLTASTSLPRKLSSPFAWLSRNSNNTGKKTASPPPPSTSATDRRNTMPRLSSTISSPEINLRKFDEDGDTTSLNAGQNSLKDRFKMLRLREEAGIEHLDRDDSPAIGLGIGSPVAASEDGENRSPPRSHRGSDAGSVHAKSTINPRLAPGTAAGMSIGPTDSIPVDWDLWQSVVYEGPAAVARTSPEELNRAIAGGIPQAIRGVVWQVLAQSKNEDLESVYRELVARGTEREHLVTSTLTRPTLESMFSYNSSVSKDRESIASSASSIHSEASSPAATTSTGLTSTTNGSPTETQKAEAQAQALVEKQQKAKDDAAALKKLEKTIRRDLGSRTSFSKYVMSAGLQDGLFGVCKAYALFDEGVGYAQGMNFIAMPLLFNMPEEEAFCLLVRLMNRYGLRELFKQDMPGLHLHLYQFGRLLEEFEPALYYHLHRRGVNPELYATQWFLTLFAYRFPLQLVLRVYDLILSEGLEGAILKFGIVLMQKNASTLLGIKEMSALTTFLKERLFDVYIDKAPSASSLLESGFFGTASGVDKEVYRADMLVQDACSVKITPEMLKSYASDWDEKRRLEKEREDELDSLRSTNTNLSQRIRNLEERAEKSDTEHVELASELVRTKVENERLKDENESLQGRVAELERIVQTQPEEVEQMLKDEMEKVMARNIEVHNENRALEEQMTDMERELVEVKLQYAQINNDYETLKQKWSNITQMLK